MRHRYDHRSYRCRRDDKSCVKDPKVFVDMGSGMLDGSPVLLNAYQHLRRELAEGMWKDLVRKGLEKVPAVWGLEAEP